MTITEDDIEVEVAVVKLRPGPDGKMRPTVLKYIEGDLPRTLEMLLEAVRIVGKLMMKGPTSPVQTSRIVRPMPGMPIPPMDPRFQRKL